MECAVHQYILTPIIAMLSIPFALVGGIWLIWFMKFNISVAIVVGGMVTTTLLCLLVIPVIYGIYLQFVERLLNR